MVDTKLGRRRTLMIGSVIMMIAFYVCGGMILGIERDNNGTISASSGAQVGAKGYVAMVSIYIFAIGVNIGQCHILITYKTNVFYFSMNLAGVPLFGLFVLKFTLLVSVLWLFLLPLPLTGQ